jgi:hypothetical protein
MYSLSVDIHVIEDIWVTGEKATTSGTISHLMLYKPYPLQNLYVKNRYYKIRSEIVFQMIFVSLFINIETFLANTVFNSC